jgi:hypothetical protein
MNIPYKKFIYKIYKIINIAKIILYLIFSPTTKLCIFLYYPILKYIKYFVLFLINLILN